MPTARVTSKPNSTRGQLRSSNCTSTSLRPPIDSTFAPRQLRFEVRPWSGSEVRHEAGAWHLRGVSGGPDPSPYVLESRLSELRLHTSRELAGPRG